MVTFAGERMKMYTIKIYFDKPGTEPVLLNRIAAGQSLLEVCLNHHIDLQHNCGGICSCSTCHLYVVKGGEYLEEQSRKEKDFINRVAHRLPGSRLACQCLLLEGTGLIELVLPSRMKA